ncbi:MAG: putative Esterase/lipase/thioesterase [Rickettsiaceae bacterium]|jgi:cellulose synthase/poly-beta-1,6-N-acetylglucosamine synthase-like glycosyltransferase|nr:putative Esterase/lipase/thioesterase [Rickettsiaceae bacterium]
MKKTAVFILLIILTSCAPSYSKIAKDISKSASKQGLEAAIYQTKNFKIFTLQKITDKTKTVRVYFEGDGKAFINTTLASPNPTPTSHFLTDLVAKDPHPNIIYIARPCQFVDDEKCQSNHPEKYWTSDRFAKEVLDSINQVVGLFSQYNLELVGYSGGATVVQFVAAYNQQLYGNIVNMRTIAGDFSSFDLGEAKINRLRNAEDKVAKNQELPAPEVVDLPPASMTEEVIQKSLDNLPDKNGRTASTKTKYSRKKIGWRSLVVRIPQIHFIADQDTVISKDVLERYLKSFRKRDCIKIATIDKATHSKGWQNRWKNLLEYEPACEATN